MDVRSVTQETLQFTTDLSSPLQKKRDRSSFEQSNDIDFQSESNLIEENLSIPNRRVTKISHTSILIKPFAEIRGHTGFLTFARKSPI